MAEITTRDGFTVLVDDGSPITLSWLRTHQWRTMVVGNHPNGMDNGSRYAYASVNGKTTLMHRILVGAGPGEQVIHLNRNGLDNRHSNLFIGRAPSCPLSGIVYERHRKQGA